ncbi:hypothetical protein F4818DRAFT_131335 [Hypoxylon cercidicola]|nr:hypothetical protein F4818DRAFT_131335 [Hypoxylon cercidicola]
MEPSNTPSDSSSKGPMNYLSTSEEGRTPVDIIAIGAVFLALPALFVAMRFYCRRRATKSWLAADDWLMLLALFFNIGMGLMLVIGASLDGLAQPTPQGWGPKDYFWVTDDAEILTEKIFFAFMLTQAVAFGLAKLSILYFYRRIFFSRTFKTLTTVMIVIVAIWTIGFFVAYLFRCGTNFWALWAPLMYLVEYCYDSKPLFYSLAISDVITDVVILSLPLFWVWRLQTTIAKRFALSGVFLLGAIEIATGIARLVVYINQSQDFEKNADGIGHLTTLMVWSMIEMSIAVIAGCLPTIWPLLSKVSLEDMMRTLRSVVSFESLRSLTRSKKQTSRSESLDRSLSMYESGPDEAGVLQKLSVAVSASTRAPT